jgi:exosortase
MDADGLDVSGPMSDAVSLDYQAQDRVRLLSEESEPNWLGLRVSAWVKIAVVTALMSYLFRFNLVRLWDKTNPFTGEANWGHAICIPFVCIYYLYVNREELLKAAAVGRGSWAGLFVMIGGILLFGYGIWPGQNDFVKDFGMVVTLFGVVLLLAGWGVMAIAWFPIAFLICGIPWPGLVYSWVAGPLQQLAAQVAVGVLSATGVKSFASGTKIIIYGYNGAERTLNVAEACAGLRSLMTFISVGAGIAFLSARPLWQKIIITVSAIPIAIFCNVLRVSGQGLLDHYVSPELSESFAHQFVGMVMLIPAFFMILGVGWVLDQIFLEEADDKPMIARQLVVRRSQSAAAVPPPAAGHTLAARRLADGASRRADMRPSSPAAAGGAARPIPVPPPPNSVLARRKSPPNPAPTGPAATGASATAAQKSKAPNAGVAVNASLSKASPAAQSGANGGPAVKTGGPGISSPGAISSGAMSPGAASRAAVGQTPAHSGSLTPETP